MAKARAVRPDIRVVFCTGLDRFKLAGIGDFGRDVLRKPFTLDASRYPVQRLPSATLANQPGGSPLFVVPLGLKAWMAEKGIRSRVVELDWWHPHTLKTPAGQVDVVLTPVQHRSARGLNDRMMTL